MCIGSLDRCSVGKVCLMRVLSIAFFVLVHVQVHVYVHIAMAVGAKLGRG